eukprot:TRINITY_DN90781_c0_g1_i1.p1 TRINITY_DN90781_c0_g1~~TRINITY_DN90781_c0_g1_i1.p1  ORF type:complete len:178 (+),score=24.36 TRINITY_DN90781_c0_g1_i1:65-598(+)
MASGMWIFDGQWADSSWGITGSFTPELSDRVDVDIVVPSMPFLPPGLGEIGGGTWSASGQWNIDGDSGNLETAGDWTVETPEGPVTGSFQVFANWSPSGGETKASGTFCDCAGFYETVMNWDPSGSFTSAGKTAHDGDEKEWHIASSGADLAAMLENMPPELMAIMGETLKTSGLAL